uniref:Glycosyl transferase group 1 n=1 Tax=Cyanothece sp. (strain PCC 7425 / ATCC 29141) TaxID=395961 RepID=B8HLJ2_CYAP4
MKVVHITPTYFDTASVIGGGERYPVELAVSMADQVDTTLVSFAATRRSYHQGKLKVELFPVDRFIYGNKVDPLTWRYLETVLRADVVHVHHLSTLVSGLATFIGRSLGKRTFVTDYGGGTGWMKKLNSYLPILSIYQQAIVYSRYGLDFIPPHLQAQAVLIKGGINLQQFCPDPKLEKTHTILYVGRILPHKGINYLIEGFRQLNHPDYTLKILGRVYDDRYYQDLLQLAKDLAVEFIHDADDQRLCQEYRSARVTVLPSVHTDCYGQYTPVPELMGFTLLESQACGTPVICTNAGAMAEFVDPGRTGQVVEQNSPAAIATALNYFLSLSPAQYRDCQIACQEWMVPLSWPVVVQKHLELYQGKA